jgi:chemotaxis protein CheD
MQIMEFDPFGTTLVRGGECLFGETREVVLVTVLGSCVSACISDPVAGVGGMNHFLLPFGRDGGTQGPPERYGDFAMRTLVEGLCRLGANRRRMRAKIFGGGRARFAGRDIGLANVEFARDFLVREGVRLVDGNVGGEVARWINFRPATGETSLKVVEKTARKTAAVPVHEDRLSDRSPTSPRF